MFTEASRGPEGPHLDKGCVATAMVPPGGELRPHQPGTREGFPEEGVLEPQGCGGEVGLDLGVQGVGRQLGAEDSPESQGSWGQAGTDQPSGLNGCAQRVPGSCWQNWPCGLWAAAGHLPGLPASESPLFELLLGGGRGG